jgi:hypothetical protein
MKINKQILLALGGLAASLSASAALLDNFDTFVTPAGPTTRGFDLTSSSGTVNDNSGLGENIAGAPASDTSFASLTRRAWLTHTVGSGDATFNNNSPGGFANWSNETGVNSTASLRYNFASPQDFVAANLDQIEVVNGIPESAVTLTIQIWSGTTPNLANPYIQGVFANAFSSGNAVANIAGFTGVNGGSAASIWSSARTIVFTLSSAFTARDVSIDEINLTTSQQVPEAKTMVPAIAMVGFAGFMAWKRRAAK